MYLGNPIFDVANAIGTPISGAKARFYLTGTTNNATTYSDAALTTPNTNPVIADSAGRFPPIYLDPDVTYRLQVLDASNTLIVDRDPIFEAGEAGTALVNIESNVSVVRLLATGNLSPASVIFNAYLNSISEVRSDYFGRFIIATSTDGSTYTNQYTSGTDENTTTYLVPSGTLFVRARIYRAGGTTTLLSQTTVSVVRDGIDGASGSGTDAVVVNLSKSSAAVFAYADGSVPDFTDIDGQVTVFDGGANETANATFSAAGSGLTGTVNTATDTPVSGKPKGYYRVTAMSQDIGALVITTTYNGVSYERSFSVSKVRTGYEIVGALPTTNLFEGRMVFLTTDDKLYRYTGTAWTTAVPAVDITGEIVAAQIANAAITTAKFAASIEPVTLVSSVPLSKSTNSIFNTTNGFMYRWDGSAYVKSVPTTDLSGTIIEAQIADAALTTAKFAASIEPVTLVSSVPGTKSTNSVFNTTNGFLYRWNGSAYVKTVPTTDLTGTIANSQIDAVAASKITGQLTDAQIADLAAAKVTGTLTNSQIADLAAAKITGQITTTQITDGAISTAKIAAAAITSNEIAANTITAGDIAAGTITATELASGSVTTAKLAAGAVTANEIASNAITAVKISAGAVETAKIAAGAITANEIATNAVTAVKIAAGSIETAKIAAGAVTATEIAANTITAGQIASGAITTDELAANAVTTAKLAAGAVTANEIAANTITASQIAANTITASQIAANTITASQIASDTITAGQIAAGAISTDELAANAVTAAKIAVGTITANELAANSVTAGKIEAAAVTAAKLAANAVTADKIEAGAVTAAKISVTNLAAMNANTGNLSVNGTLTLSTSGKIITSGTAYNGNGIFLGEDGAGVYKFSVGGASGKLAFDGTNLSIPGGLIVSGTVATDAIVNNAVTIGYSEETDAALSVTDAWQDAETIQVTVASGQEVDIHWSLACALISTMYSNTGGTLYVKLLRDSTEIYAETEIAAVPPGTQAIEIDVPSAPSELGDIYQARSFRTITSGMDFDAPGTGTFTYKLQVKHNTGADASIDVSKRRLKAILRKK